MEFVDREKELAYLESEYDKPGSSFVVIYGRRRVGKTRLIKEFLKDKDGIYFLATEEPERINQTNFQQLLYELFSIPILSPTKVLGWYDLFYILSSTNFKKKFVIVIDEFQYLVKTNRAVTSVFQKIWDELLVNKNFFLILCGSSLSLMEKETLSHSSPLYGRRTGQIKLKPFGFSDFKKFFDGASIDPVELYSLVGGVPKYIEALSLRKDVFETVSANFLSVNSFFFEEPYFLLSREVKEIGTYFSLMKTIAAGNRKLGKISSILGLEQNKLGYYLSRLEDIDLIQRETPVTESNPEKSKSGLYRIKDYFLDFWFKYIYPYRSYIEIGQVKFVEETIKRTFRERHVSFVYEDVCRERLIEMNVRNELPIKVSRIGRWWYREDEIDILGVDENDEIVLVGECKYTSDPADVGLYYQLEQKLRKLKIEREPIYVFFSYAGFAKSFVQEMKNRKNVLLFEGA